VGPTGGEVKGEHDGHDGVVWNLRVKLLPRDWSISRARFLLHRDYCYPAASSSIYSNHNASRTSGNLLTSTRSLSL
jgi:hypothetical protein